MAPVIPLPRVVSVLAALWVCAAGLWWGTHAAGSADAYGYVSQAALWLRGGPIIHQPIALTMPWPDAEWTFTPLGYRPGLASGTLVPVHAAGLPIVMAVFEAIGGLAAVYAAVPALAAVAVLATSRLATQLSGPSAGAVAALLLASSPTVLFSTMWPMSDVPAMAWWALSLALITAPGVAAAAGAGAAAALAILTRPNLVALVLAPGMFLVVALLGGRLSRRIALTRLLTFGTLGAAGCVAVAAIHTTFYGGPFQTGYGSITQMYQLSNVPSAVSAFAMRPLDTEPVLLLLGIVGAVAAFVWREHERATRTAWLSAGAVALVLVSYAFYVTFADWWYLRFLLPAYPAMAALAGVGVLRLARLAPECWHGATVACICAIAVGVNARQAQGRGVFEVHEEEARYRAVGRFVSEHLPPNAAFFAFQQSGSLRHYAGRLTLRFDVLPHLWFGTAIDKLRARGYRPYFVVEDPERQLFIDRFHGVHPLGRLDWPAVAELNGPVRVRIYDPADRGKWREGTALVTQTIQP